MFETKSSKEVLSELQVDSKQGLSFDEAGKRMLQYGPNKLAEKKKKPLILVFLSNFNDPMIFILIAAALLSVAISLYNTLHNGDSFDFADPIIIMGVCVLNAIIGTVQENKAENEDHDIHYYGACIVRIDSAFVLVLCHGDTSCLNQNLLNYLSLTERVQCSQKTIYLMRLWVFVT